MHAIQYILIAFAAFAISRVLLRFRRGGMRMLDLVLWLVFWAGVVVVAVRPETTSLVAAWLGVARGADTAIYFAVLILFSLLFRTFTRIEDMDRQITRIVRANALKDLEALLAAEQKSDPAQPK